MNLSPVRSAPFSPALTATTPASRRRIIPDPLFWLLMLAAAICYLLPWVGSTPLSLTFGAYDLAEWISLRLPDRPMDLVLLLRVIPVLLVTMVGLHAGAPRLTGRWWLALVITVVTAGALLPPLEYFLDGGLRGDVNYSQQAMLALYTLIAGGITLTGLFPALRPALLILTGAVSIIVSLSAVSQANAIMTTLALHPQTGVGVIGYVICVGLLMIREVGRLIALVRR